MNLAKNIAAYFNVAESSLVFDDAQLSADSCTVMVNGAPFDVWLDYMCNIRGSAPAV